MQLEPSPWNFDIIFDDFDGRFWIMLTQREASRFPDSIPERPTALRGSHESSGALVGPFRSCLPGVRRILDVFAISNLRNRHVRAGLAVNSVRAFMSTRSRSLFTIPVQI